MEGLITPVFKICYFKIDIPHIAGVPLILLLLKNEAEVRK